MVLDELISDIVLYARPVPQVKESPVLLLLHDSHRELAVHVSFGHLQVLPAVSQVLQGLLLLTYCSLHGHQGCFTLSQY